MRVYFADTSFSQGSSMWNYWRTANQPIYERGVATAYLDDDGSPDFDDLYRRTKEAPVLSPAT